MSTGRAKDSGFHHDADVLQMEDEVEHEPEDTRDGHLQSSTQSEPVPSEHYCHSPGRGPSRQGSQGNQSFLRHRARTKTNERMEEEEFVFVESPENEVEAQRMEQNYMFGFKKWKSHVTKRPLQERSEVVQELYKPPLEIKPFSYPTIGVSNVIYALLIGWLMALIYSIVGLLMFFTIIAWRHGIYCFKLARYFLWPFGYFVQEQTEYRYIESNDSVSTDGESVVNSAHNVRPPNDNARLVTSLSSSVSNSYRRIDNSQYWKRPSTYVWLLLGVPFALLLHLLVFFISWMTVIFLPVAKLNMMAIKRLLFLPPEKLKVSKTTAIKPGEQSHEVIMCSYQAANFYSYKYTVDGMNIFFVNMLFFVVIAVVVGFADTKNRFTTPTGRFAMGLLAIIPLAHYIGMAIASISAQSNHVVGAVLNATFGSIVEIILYISSLLKQRGNVQEGICYSEIVKSALTGTLLATMLFIPGICMMVGGLKHKEQRFNVRSMSVSATLLFISVVGVFTPTIFTITLGGFECNTCYNSTNETSLKCSGCTYVYKLTDDDHFLNHKLRPLVYVCVILLFLAYVIGLIFSLKTHAHIIQGSSSHSGTPQANPHSKPDVHWGRIKSTVILLIAVALMSLSAEVVVQNLQPILSSSTVIKPVFIGVTLLAVVPDLPEIINGIQFALKNNINLSLEIGCSVAVQVCLLQIPVLVLVDAIVNLGFNLVFNDLHLWSVIISVIIINYIFVDGKSDYFQGCMLCIIYFFLLAMFFFAGDSAKTDCSILG
ncbi:low affinity vacuolar monovalent cation/H(+) antiporter-like [Lytechinus variegatus]|uniref:low affinity vacuolar monovalent cation/H(+) antiporter-like n=1 Tax=Lytechinus variegatus TaxID=7654 RepID=UPI001BB235A3|nr:low affinity vacuolar monovalent cation/H(+) antiporter-like [Lytechinus variegatus]